jgi:hypothetical protein
LNRHGCRPMDRRSEPARSRTGSILVDRICRGAFVRPLRRATVVLREDQEQAEQTQEIDRD